MKEMTCQLTKGVGILMFSAGALSLSFSQKPSFISLTEFRCGRLAVQQPRAVTI